MNLELITEYPLWYIIFCFLIAGIFTAILYYKDNNLIELSGIMKNLLAVLRFIASFIIAFLLLSPFIKTNKKEVEKPALVILHDNTSSILASADSGFVKNSLANEIEKLKNTVSDKFDVKEYFFDAGVKDHPKEFYTGNETNISKALMEIKNRYENRNLGSVLLISDGLYNRGSNPLKESEELKVPIYTLALGDTVLKKDIAIRDVKHNAEVFLGNAFPMEITVKATQAASSKTILRLFENDKQIQIREIEIGRSNYIQTFNFIAEAKEKGIYHYSIRIDALSGEENTLNNRRDFYVDVKERKVKIVLACAAPHPDVSAIKQVVEQNQGYEIEIYTADKFNASPEGKDLLILHGLPSNRFTINSTLNNFRKSGVAIFYIISSSTSLAEFNKLNTGLSVTDYRNLSNEVLANANTGFGLFSFSDELKSSLATLPPLISPFGSYRISEANVMLNQQIGAVKTLQPLLLFSQNENSKTGVLAGEGYWRWRLRDYAIKQNQDLSNEFMQKIIQYLSVRESEGRLKIRVRSSFVEGEEIRFMAELYDASYTMISIPELKLNIKAADGKLFPFIFSRSDKAYVLNAGSFQPGIYSYIAETILGEETITASGKFTIAPGQLEFAETNADHSLLYTLSEESGAEMFYPSNFENISHKLMNDDRYHSIAYVNQNLEDLVRMKWIFFLIVSLLSIEWLIRKRAGAY